MSPTKENKQGGKKRNSADASESDNSIEDLVMPKKQKLAKPVAETNPANIAQQNKIPPGMADLCDENRLKINTSLLNILNDLVTDDETVLKETIGKVIWLLSQLNDNEQKKHVDYLVKRCVRACGSPRSHVRVSNSTCLTVLLQVFPNETPLQKVYQLLEKELMYGSGKEDTHAISGQIFSCSAILRSGRLKKEEAETKKFTEILINTMHRRTYQSCMAYTTLRASFELFSQEVFEEFIWKALKKELLIPWPKQTINTVETLMSISRNFPDVMTADVINDYWNGSELLCPKSYKDLYRIFFKETCTRNALPNTIDAFGFYIANNKNLFEFWKKVVDPDLQNATKLQQRFILRVLTIILENQSKPDWHNLLTNNLINMLVTSLKQQNKREPSNTYVNDFADCLVIVCGNLKSDEDRLQLVYKLIKPPLTITDIEKYTKSRKIRQMLNTLGKNSVISIYDFYHNIFTGQIAKKNNDTATRLDYERIDAGYTLQYLLTCKSVKDSIEWRSKKLCSLFTYGIFHINDQLEICEADEASEFSNAYNRQSRQLFFHSLDIHKSSINMEKDLMGHLIDHVNLLLTNPNNQDKFIVNFDEATKKTWTQTKTVLDSLMNNETVPKALIILLQHLTIRLFNDPKTELSTIADVCSCIKIQENMDDNLSDNCEQLPWIHVLVDIALHLLSLNVKLLRDLVMMVFKNLSQHFDISALHYILSLLNMKDGYNPLISQNDEDFDDENDGAEGSDSEDEDQKSGDSENDQDVEDENTDEEDTDEEDTEDDEDEIEENDDNGDGETITEIQFLRNDLSQVLMANGAVPMANDDADSIDLNDITEEQGRKLDEAVASVFRARNKSSLPGRPNNKKTKSYRSMTTTTMHFRLRVLDLVQIISEQRSGSITVATTIIQSLYELLQYCTAKELTPLQGKTEKILNKVINKTNYYVSSKDHQDDDVVQWSQVDMCSIVRSLVNTAILIKDRVKANCLLTKCFIFLILNGSRLPEKKKEENIISLCLEYLQKYIKKRSAKLNFMVFMELFTTRWSGIWQLAKTLAADGILNQTRVLRRIQAYKLIITVYRNNQCYELNKEIIKLNLLDVERSLYQHISELAKAKSNVKINGKEVEELFELFTVIEQCYEKGFQLNVTSILCTAKTAELMQLVRQRVILTKMNNYNKYCSIRMLTVISNSDIPTIQINDDDNESDMEDPKGDGNNNNFGNQVPNKVEKNKALKHKRSNDENTDDNNVVGAATQKVSANKQKKLKKEQRLNAASRGLNSGFFQQDDAADIEESSNNDDQD